MPVVVDERECVSVAEVETMYIHNVQYFHFCQEVFSLALMKEKGKKLTVRNASTIEYMSRGCLRVRER